MKIYNFSGFGNFSSSFGWDNGLTSSLGSETTLENALEKEHQVVTNSCLGSYGLPSDLEEGVFYNINEHGGSRNVYGFVIASTKEQASEMLAEFDNSFDVVEYEED